MAQGLLDDYGFCADYQTREMSYEVDEGCKDNECRTIARKDRMRAPVQSMVREFKTAEEITKGSIFTSI